MLSVKSSGLSPSMYMLLEKEMESEEMTKKKVEGAVARERVFQEF